MSCTLRPRSDAILIKLIYPSIWRGPGKSGIRPHLGCGCNDVSGKLGLGDTAWLGTVQPLQGEFCETGVPICFKSDGT